MINVVAAVIERSDRRLLIGPAPEKILPAEVGISRAEKSRKRITGNRARTGITGRTRCDAAEKY